MKKHRVFNKGEYVYCLLASYTDPDTLIPVKGIIIDTKWDLVNPLYKIKIIKFYDNINFLKKHFFDMLFKCSFDKRSKHLPLKPENFSRVVDLEERLNEKDSHRFHVIVESVMCTKTSPELKELFNRVQFFLISKNLKEIREFSARAFYKGPFSIDSIPEFNKRFKAGWEDKFKKENLDIDKYLDTLS
jgi:hypothetical protein